ncbi:MAG TPA: multicopper oxidase domain-containing protein [Candidatus Bathyarchaeia archaeon]|nr:multicopper oxidase domain-containing protein [Candidatus Bathyarchaeia archaeon]
MRSTFRLLQLVLVGGLSLCAAAQQICPARPSAGTAISNPLDLYSQNGTLTLNLSLESQVGPTGFTHYCYVYMNNGNPVEAPTLRLNPGDQLVLNFSNNITVTGKLPKSRHAPMAPMEMGDVQGAMAQSDPCLGGMVTATTTNVHFHGLNVPPICHQDEVVKTIIPNNGQPFQYSIQIPANDPPGLYWYHPHPHGFSAPQVYGGASGALIIEGTNTLTQGLNERVLIVRRNVDAVTDDDGQFTLNFEPANYPRHPLPVINMTAGRKEFWRVLNASTNGFLALQVFSGGPQQLLVISLDGIPLSTPVNMTTIYLPPAGRVEFIVPPLTANTPALFLTQGFDTGPIGDRMPSANLANIVVAPGKYDDEAHKAQTVPPLTAAPRFSGLASVTPATTRSLYFSELNVGTNGPGQFFVTVAGQQQKLYSPTNPPAITTKVGAVEDWTVSNQTGEPHAFHIHQLHFLVTAINGVSVPNPYMVDTVTVPNWTGSGPYPSVTVRMDFRDPNIAGTFIYHCHILDHEDGGMMATIVVNP